MKKYKVYRGSNERGRRYIDAYNVEDALNKYRALIESEKDRLHPEAYKCIMYGLNHNDMIAEEE